MYSVEAHRLPGRSVYILSYPTLILRAESRQSKSMELHIVVNDMCGHFKPFKDPISSIYYTKPAQDAKVCLLYF